MKYTFKNKTFTIPDKEIDKIMEQFFNISISEACEIYLSDKDLIVVDEAAELEAKAQKNRITTTIHGARADKKDRKPREKKENPLKKEIIAKIYSILKDFDDVNVRNDEKYIDFSVNGLEFTVNLVQHRQKK